MNHTYRLVCNEAGQCQIPAPEIARSRSKRSGVKPLVVALLAACALDAHALPTDGAVSAGSGSIAQNGADMTVHQSSQNLAVNWQSFNIGANERVSFVQPNASSIALNRVLGSDPSQILGQLNANGQVWILNPNGLLFGASAQVNVGGLVASTLNLSDADFLAGRRTFSSPLPQAGEGQGRGSVINQGSINATDGGYVALLGGQVSNEGIIVAQLGTVALAAGNQITLDFNGDKLLNVQVEQGALDALAQNKQLIRADGGTVLMTAQAADALATAVVNNTGVIEARSIENHNGVIKLLGDMDHGMVNVGGTLDASATLPPLQGEGGGGDGLNGGFIETSAAHVKIADGAVVTTKAENGQSGTWLIDPIDFTIASGSGALTTSGIGASTLSTNLGAGNIAIATNGTTAGNGDIFVNSAVSWSANNKLTLTAHRNIVINASLNGSGASSSLALEYGQASAGGGGSNYTLGSGAQINLPAGGNFSTKLGTGGATTAYTVITDLGAAGDATVAPGTMTLQGMRTGLAGKYVLGADINNAGDTNTWNGGLGFAPVGYGLAVFPFTVTPFTGVFDGLGHTITGLTINRVWENYVALFGYTDGATLRNVGFINSSISGQLGVGALAGISANGNISYSYADGGSVTGTNNNVGGLMGGGSGSISNSYANVSVTGGNTGTGGLKGAGSGNVSNSYATGSVHGITDTGGLVGQQSGGTISNSYATGAVTATGLRVGGLVGNQTGGSVTNSSYWNVATTNQGGSAGGTPINTTALMQTQSTFGGFDFTTTPVWRIYEGRTTPLLASFLTSLTVTGSASKTYDGLAFSGGGVSYSVTPNANLLGTVSYSGTSQGAVNAGSYVITPSGLYSNQKGYDISYADGALTVNKANLSVTANAASKIYDGLAWSGNNGVAYSGFVNGETVAVLGGALAYGGSAQGAVNAGSYAITPSGLTSGNYTIAFNDGTLTIGTRVPAIPGVPVDGYSGAIASVATGASASPSGSVVAIAGGSTSASSGAAFLTVDSGESAAGSNVQLASTGDTRGAADSGPQGTADSDAQSAASSTQGAAGGNAKGESGDTATSDEEAAADSFATEYALVTRGCGQRLPSGLGC